MPLLVYADHMIPQSVQKCLEIEDKAIERYYLHNKGIIKASYLDEQGVEQQGFYVSLEGMKEIHYRYGLVVDAEKCWRDEVGKQYVNEFKIE